MGAHVVFEMKLSDGRPAAGARIVATNRDAWSAKARHSEGTAGPDGRVSWPSLDTGTKGDMYDFEAHVTDTEGVAWRGTSTHRISHDDSFEMGLAPYVPPLQEFSPEFIARLQGMEGGREVAQSLGELETARKAGLVLGVVALASHVIEGLIRLRARSKGVWDGEYDGDTLAALIRREKIKRMLPAGWYDKLDGFSKIRKPGVHSKGAMGQPEEASLSIGYVRGLAEEFFAS